MDYLTRTKTPPTSTDTEKAPLVAIFAGCDAHRHQGVTHGGWLHLIGNNDGHMLLSMLCPSIELARIHVAPGYFRQSKRWNPDAADLLWNIISDVDQNADTLDIACKLVSTANRPIVNPPSLMGRTRRHTLAGLLQGLDGVIVPKVLLLRNSTLERVSKAVAEAGFRFPAILRRTGSHNGEVMGVFGSVEDMAQIFGDRKNTYYLTEFYDVRRGDGFYRKSRFFFVGDTIITRQHVIADQWYVHGGAGVLAEHPALRDEARAMLIDGFEAIPAATRRAVDAIRQTIGFDYCGLDCCIQEDGQVVVFEANATMNFSPRFDNPATQHNRAALPRMLDALRRLIEAKTGRSLADVPCQGLEN